MKLRIDFHVHTVHSKDGYIPLKKIPQIIKEKHLDGVAVTDHNLISKNISDIELIDKSIVIIPGIEVSTSQGHLIGLWVQTDISKGLRPLEAVDEIHSQGGIAVSPHPFDLFTRGVNPNHLGHYLDAIETINASSIPFGLATEKAEKVANFFNLPKLGGSDSHVVETIGDAYTEIEVSDPSTDEIFKSVKRGLTNPQGKPTKIKYRIKKLRLDFSKKWNI